MLVEFHGEEDNDDDDDDDGVQELELYLQDRDRYPLLPSFDSNIPLNVLKQILRVYVQEV